MLTTSSPPVGAIAIGQSGAGYPVIRIEGDRVTLQTPDGLKRVPLGAINRWEHPAQPTTPQPGQRVLLLTEIETASDIILAGTEGTIVEPKTKGLTWAKFEGSDRPCMVMPDEFHIVS